MSANAEVKQDISDSATAPTTTHETQRVGCKSSGVGVVLAHCYNYECESWDWGKSRPGTDAIPTGLHVNRVRVRTRLS